MDSLLSSGCVCLCIVPGHYVFIETSAPFVAGDKAQLQSLNMSASTSTCVMSFWYGCLLPSVASFALLVVVMVLVTVTVV